ncbi:Armadillo-type fold protein [Cordyceps fumosorosea ARSEF 2679]|uniref:Pre-mRNA-splicing factor CWC22 n=1 Tax=Cordyceps fumosorosea (strain ARSEF 2679) TaxID=1081104 RepID=A0A168EKH8_CORFA|nr:Armadillo-type fold protein [Cordyceps fumosorosea ARSEF 2679]OAA73923.1 Armadillo-type fold protein [Cordyceps fumosorosea ARSEF 2679]
MASAEVGIPRRERDRDRGDRGPRGGGNPRREGGDSYRPGGHARSRARTPPPVPTEEQKQAAAKAEYEKLLTMRSGGTYIPPARLRALQSQITDKTSKEYQRMAWEALKKSINGLINKVHTANIKHIVPELFGENLIRGRGLFCRSIMKAQAASLPFTPIYAAMVAIVNTKLPQVGELLVKRLVMQFRKGFKRNDKSVCLASTTFLAHLINQQVQHEMLAGQILLLLLNKPTDDSVEISVGFCREVGQFLEDMRPTIANVIFDQFRNILHEAGIDKRTQYMIEVLFQVRKDRYKDNPAVKEELDLVEEEDQITHQVELDGEINVQDSLNIFKFDEQYEENEEAYKKLKAEILGEASDDEDDEDDGDDDSSDDEEDQETKEMEIKDQSNADLVNLRRTIYLTIMSSADPEEATHKLMKINLPVGQEPEMPSMIVECCSQEKTYTKFFGLIAERFAKINRLWCDLFEQSFQKYYETIHRYENNKLRNIAMLFGHMFGSDALGWHCLSVIHLNEDETTSSSRIFIKILFQSIVEEIGVPKIKSRMADEVLRPSLAGLFPQDNPRNIRFSINYFTSIGLGALTEEMREFLQNMPKPALPAPAAAARGDDDSDSDSVSSYSSRTASSYSRSRSRSRSYSRSRSPRRIGNDRGRSLSRTPSRRSRGESYSRSRSRSASYSSRGRTRSRSFSDAGDRKRRTPSRSATPPRRARRGAPYSRSRSRSYDSYSDASRSRSRSRSAPPPRRRERDASSPPPPPRRGNSSSVSRSPAPRKRGRSPSHSRSPSRSRSPPARRVRAEDRSLSRSRSPPPRRGGDGRRRSSSPAAAKRRRANSSSVSRSPPPVKRGRRGS